MALILTNFFERQYQTAGSKDLEGYPAFLFSFPAPSGFIENILILVFHLETVFPVWGVWTRSIHFNMPNQVISSWTWFSSEADDIQEPDD